MKKALLILPVVFFILPSCSHRETRVEAKERTITVTGSSDGTLTPDEVTLTISIAEYYKEQYDPNIKPKDYKNLVKLDAIEKPIMDLLKKNGIADSCIHFSYMNTSWNWYSYEEKTPVHFEKTLGVKFKDFDKAVAIIQQLDTKGISSLSLGDFHSTKEQQMRKDLKAEALKNAKEKAEFMLGKIDHTIGDIVSVKEVAENNSYWNWQPSQSSMSNSTYSSAAAAPAVGPQDIKMRYEVEAEFEIE
ncbi:hypothetical protein BH09BAC5_BH09BAC5_13820 [soil metagenome]